MSGTPIHQNPHGCQTYKNLIVHVRSAIFRSIKMSRATYLSLSLSISRGTAVRIGHYACRRQNGYRRVDIPMACPRVFYSFFSHVEICLECILVAARSRRYSYIPYNNILLYFNVHLIYIYIYIMYSTINSI